MIGVRCARFGVLTLALLAAACAAPPPKSSAPPALATVEPKALAGPAYRFVPRDVPEFGQRLRLAGGRIGLITDGNPGREIVNPDGSVELSEPAGQGLLGVVALPARLGGGFLFWDTVLYRTHSFLGPLEPIIKLPTNAIGIELGPDYVLLLLTDAPPRAFALDPVRAVPLSPKGVIDVVAASDGRALALDVTGRALASTDAGKSWKDVTAEVGARVGGVDEGEHGVAFVTHKGDAWLQPDGQFVLLPVADKRVPVQDTPALLLLRALSDGLPLPGRRALVGAEAGTRVVDLLTGSASPMKPAGPEGSGCMPISLDDEGLLFCVSYSPETATTVVSHALGTPIIEKKFVGTPHFVPGRELGIIARCTGGYADDRICLRQRGGVWTEVKPSTAVLRKWQPVFWLPRENGGVSLIVSEREVFEGEPKLALLDPQTNRVTPWDLPIAQLALDRESWRPLPGLTVLADGSVRGYTTNGSIAVDPHGHATLGTRKFVSVSSAAAHALARDEAEHLWQSSDWGAHWQEIAPPPFDETPEGSNAKVNPRPSGRATRIDCSLSGCALEHSSGLGSWIRLGFPEDPPAAKASLGASTPSTAVASVSTQPPQQLLSLSQPALPQLNCKSRSEGPLHATTLPAKLPEANAGEQWQAALAGGRALARRGKHTFANLEYRNVFADDQLFHQGLRATLHLQAEDTELKEMLGEKTPWDVRFVEPFDEQGRLRSFSASIQDWSAFGIATPGNASPQAKRLRELTESDFDHHQRDGGAARPLLSSEPGRAGGVLLLGELSLFARNNGIVPVRPGCYPVSGYLDGRGKGFVACGERDDYSTRIEALDAPLRDVFRAPPVTLSRDRERAGLHFFPPGESLLVNPDAIAVGRDGKFGLLRLPAGNAPPTADNPAWFLAAKSAPVALAPWSTLESASSPHCAKGDGYRAIVQTGKVWLDVLGAPDAGEGMTALVRWGTERVCLEAVEVGYDVIQAAGSRDLLVFAVARFAGARPGAGFVGTESAALQKPATCELAAPGFFPPRPREPRVAPPPAAQQRPRWDMRKPMY